MQYPPRRFRDQNNNPIINQPDGPGPDVLEALPDDIQTFSTPYDLVHFDLDPLNGKSAQVKYIEIYSPDSRAPTLSDSHCDMSTGVHELLAKVSCRRS